MPVKRRALRQLLVLAAVMTSIILGSGTAAAAELDDYLWERRPLLLFAPAEKDPRLVETLSRIEASSCEFADRDMLTGVVVRQGNSTIDGRIIGADESQRLVEQYAVDAEAFTVLLIGKDGGEKLRVAGVPDLQTIFAVIDGMPMRSAEMGSSPGSC